MAQVARPHPTNPSRLSQHTGRPGMTTSRARQRDATKRIFPAGLLLALVLTVPATERPLALAEPSAKAEPATGRKPTAESTCSLRIMTLNLAHGRGTAGHQATLSREQIAANLQKVADLIRRHRPDVLALQEADDPSVWSGWFDHVQWLRDLHFLTNDRPSLRFQN